MTQEKLGIDTIVELMEYGFNLAIHIGDITDEESQGGSKVTFSEIIGSLNLMLKIPAIITKAPRAYMEWLDVDEEEQKILKHKFAEKFNIANENIETIIVEVWFTLVGLGRLVALAKKAKPKES